MSFSQSHNKFIGDEDQRVDKNGIPKKGSVGLESTASSNMIREAIDTRQKGICFMRGLMVLAIVVSLTCSIGFYFVLSKCEDNDCQPRHYEQFEEYFGLKTEQQLFFSLPMICLLVYLATSIGYIPLLIVIFRKFKQAYPEIMEDGKFKCKLVSFFVAQQIFILWRGWLYFQLNFLSEILITSHTIKIQIYISEIILAFILMYIAFRNLQTDDREQLSVSERSSLKQGIRSSLLNPRKRHESDTKYLKFNTSGSKEDKRHFSKEKVYQAEQSALLESKGRWSISNASSDFNRQGLMGSMPGGLNKMDSIQNFAEDEVIDHDQYQQMLKKLNYQNDING